jgi:hypothetical protein
MGAERKGGIQPQPLPPPVHSLQEKYYFIGATTDDTQPARVFDATRSEFWDDEYVIYAEGTAKAIKSFLRKRIRFINSFIAIGRSFERELKIAKMALDFVKIADGLNALNGD